MTKPIYVINGPNLNRLGKREPEIYGHTTLAEVEEMCRVAAGARPIVFRQSNAEHEIIGWIHEAIDEGAGIIINPAAFTHTSVAIRDALAAVEIPFIEVHLSNPHAREPFRRTSYFSDLAVGVVCGFGASSYQLALTAALDRRETATGA